MFIWTGAQGRAQAAPSGKSTPLLRHLAGAYAPRIAGLWPAPHAPFIGAPADRRHLVCLVLSRNDGQIDPERAELLLGAPLKRAVREALTDAPAGLARALGHIGETAWEADDYALLVALLSSEGTARAIQHAKAIGLERVRVLGALPDALREVGLGDKGLTADRARLLAEVFHAIVARDGEAEARRKARTWAAGTSLNDSLERVRVDLAPPFPAPPFPGSDTLRLLPDRAALLDAARRYRNCLASYMVEAMIGESAFYEWTGQPGAVVQVTTDPLFGWQVGQARGLNNDGVDDEARAAIVAELRSWGVHVGRGYWGLDGQLARAQAASFTFQTVESVIEDLFCD